MQLVSHPFIKKYEDQQVDLAGFVHSVFDPTERLKDLSDVSHPCITLVSFSSNSWWRWSSIRSSLPTFILDFVSPLPPRASSMLWSDLFIGYCNSWLTILSWRDPDAHSSLLHVVWWSWGAVETYGGPLCCKLYAFVSLSKLSFS